MRGKADFYLSSRIATRPGFPGRVLCCLVNYTIRCDSKKKKTHIAKICYNEVGTQQKTFGSPLAPTPTKNLKRLPRRYVFISAPLFYAFFLFPSTHRSSLPSRRGRRPRRPARFPSRRPSVLAPFAFSCWRRGTAERWMRSEPSFPLTSRQRTCIGFPL